MLLDHKILCTLHQTFSHVEANHRIITREAFCAKCDKTQRLKACLCHHTAPSHIKEINYFYCGQFVFVTNFVKFDKFCQLQDTKEDP